METMQIARLQDAEADKGLWDVVPSSPDPSLSADRTFAVVIPARAIDVDPKTITESDEAALSSNSEALLISPTSSCSLLSPKSEALSDLEFDAGSEFPAKSLGPFSTISLDADDNDELELLTPRARKRIRKSKAERKQRAIQTAFEFGERFSLPYGCFKIVHKRTSIITVPLSKDRSEVLCSQESELMIIDFEIDGKTESHKVLRVAVRETDDGNDDGEDLYDELWVLVYFEDNVQRFRSALPEREVTFSSGTKRDFGQWPEKYPIIGEASMLGRQSIVRYLLENLKCCPNVQHGKGLRSPLQLAAYYGHIQVVRLLLSFGAKTNSRDLNGETPLQAAVCSGHQAVIAMIRKCSDERRRASIDDVTKPTSPRPDSWPEATGISRQHSAELSPPSLTANRDKDLKHGFGSGTPRGSDRILRSQQDGLGSPDGPISSMESVSFDQKGSWKSRQRRASSNNCAADLTHSSPEPGSASAVAPGGAYHTYPHTQKRTSEPSGDWRQIPQTGSSDHEPKHANHEYQRRCSARGAPTNDGGDATLTNHSPDPWTAAAGAPGWDHPAPHAHTQAPSRDTCSGSGQCGISRTSSDHRPPQQRWHQHHRVMGSSRDPVTAAPVVGYHSCPQMHTQIPSRDPSGGGGEHRISRTSSDHGPKHCSQYGRPQLARGAGANDWPSCPSNPSLAPRAAAPAAAGAVATCEARMSPAQSPWDCCDLRGGCCDLREPRGKDRNSSMEGILKAVPKGYAGWSRRKSHDCRSDLVDTWRS